MSEPWCIRGTASSAASRGLVNHHADATLSPDGAREVARRLIQAADDADAQRTGEGYVFAESGTFAPINDATMPQREGAK